MSHSHDSIECFQELEPHLAQHLRVAHVIGKRPDDGLGQYLGFPGVLFFQQDQQFKILHAVAHRLVPNRVE